MFSRFALLFAASVAAASDAHSWKQLPPIPDPLGVAAPFAGVSGGALLVAGGANFPTGMPWEGGKKVWHDRVRVLDEPDGAWREAGKLPRPLAYGVSVTVNGCLLCIGGSDATRHYSEVLALEWREGALAQSETHPPALPIALANAAGAVDANDVVYVACGSFEPGEKAASNRVFAAGYRWKTLEWRELPPLPAEPRLLPAAAAVGEAFYLFGGAALEPRDDKIVRRYLRDAWCHTWADGWKRLADLPRPVVAAPSPAPVVNGRILLIAGDDGSRTGFTPVEKHPGFPNGILAYDLARDAWREAGETPAPRATVPCVEWHGMFVVPSGEVRPGVRSPEVWSFSAR